MMVLPMSRGRRPTSHLVASALAASALAALCACGSTAAPDTCVDAPTYARDVAPIVAEKCLSCHSSALAGPQRRGAPDGVDLDDWTLVEPRQAAVADAITSGREPPFGVEPAVTAEERALVKEWRDCAFRK